MKHIMRWLKQLKERRRVESFDARQDLLIDELLEASGRCDNAAMDRIIDRIVDPTVG